MDKRELKLIQELMDALSEEMEYSEDDFSERLGKPKVEVVKIEGKLPEDEMEFEEDFDSEELPEDEDSKFKKRLMGLRG